MEWSRDRERRGGGVGSRDSNPSVASARGRWSTTPGRTGKREAAGPLRGKTSSQGPEGPATGLAAAPGSPAAEGYSRPGEPPDAGRSLLEGSPVPPGDGAFKGEPRILREATRSEPQRAAAEMT